MMETKKKYQNWGNFLKRNREKFFRSARDFCAKKAIKISYPQYSRYESGEQLPSVDQALELFKILQIPLIEGLLEWSRVQVSDPEIQSELDRLKDQARQRNSGKIGNMVEGGSSTHSNTSIRGLHDLVPLDDVIVFNRSHLKLFSSDPTYRDIFTYVNSFGPEKISAQEIADALQIPKSKVERMLEKLTDLGIIVCNGGVYSASKRNFYFPDDQDFFELRNANLGHNARTIINRLKFDDLTKRKAFRSLLTREMTPKQVEYTINRLEEIVKDVVGFEERPEAESIYSVCILVGERFSRMNRLQRGSVLSSELSQ